MSVLEVKTSIELDNLVLTGLEAELVAGNAVPKSYVDSSLQGAVSVLNGSDVTLNARVDTVASELSNEEQTRSSADGILTNSINEEKTRAEGVEFNQGLSITNLESNKYDKEGGSISGEVKLDSYLQFGEFWRVKGSGSGDRLTFQHYSDNQWKNSVPFISRV